MNGNAFEPDQANGTATVQARSEGEDQGSGEKAMESWPGNWFKDGTIARKIHICPEASWCGRLTVYGFRSHEQDIEPAERSNTAHSA